MASLKNIGLKNIFKTVLTKLVGALKWLAGKAVSLVKGAAKSASKTAAPATAAATPAAQPGWFGWAVGFLRTFAVWPAIVLVSAYLFVHALAFFSLDDWLGWHIAVVVWWMLAGVAYYVLVFVEHETTQAAIVWVTKGMVLSCISAYSWHYGVTKNDTENAGLQFQVMYSQAAQDQCATRLAKYEKPASKMDAVVTTAMPPKAEPAPAKPAAASEAAAKAIVKAVADPAAKAPTHYRRPPPKRVQTGSSF